MNKNIDIETKIETMREDSFMKKLLKNRLNQKGLTLIELLAVIVILAIVAAIAIPAIGGLIENSRIKAVKSDAIMILNAANLEKSSDGVVFGASKTTVNPEYVQDAGAFSAAGSYSLSEDASGNIFITTGTAIQAGNSATVDFDAASLTTINSEDADSDGSTVTVVKN